MLEARPNHLFEFFAFLWKNYENLMKCWKMIDFTWKTTNQTHHNFTLISCGHHLFWISPTTMDLHCNIENRWFVIQINLMTNKWIPKISITCAKCNRSASCNGQFYQHNHRYINLVNVLTVNYNSILMMMSTFTKYVSLTFNDYISASHSEL